MVWQQASAASHDDTVERQGSPSLRLCHRGTPLTLYLDTSALIKLLVPEQGSEDVVRFFSKADTVVASRITWVETYSALRRTTRAGRVGPDEYEVKETAFLSMWKNFSKVEIKRTVVELAAVLADRYALRAYDAMQLACALKVADATDLLFLCFDNDLNKAAVDEGVNVAALT